MSGKIPEKVVVVGGGQAAVSAIVSLRQWGFDGRITLVADEPYLPYQRPPLSKAYMKGELAEERLFLKHVSWYEDNGIEINLGIRATRIDRSARRVMLEHGGHMDYDTLILAAGARARRLPIWGADLANVFYLRGLADVERIRPGMVPGKHITIIGAGYIGLEAAAVARQMGLEVTVLEYASRVLERVTSPLVSEYYKRQHCARGVKVVTDARIRRLTGGKAGVTGIELDDGSIVRTEMVLIGIGIEPNVELARDASVRSDNGVRVDRDARTSDESIYATGDCSNRPLVHFNRSGRLESVHNAVEQGRLAAASILGRPRPAEDCPWFWSDQYHLKLQIAGLSAGYDEAVVRGDPESDNVAVFYLKEGRLLSTDAVNSPREFLSSKKLITSGASVEPQALCDTSIPMKEIVELATAT